MIDVIMVLFWLLFCCIFSRVLAGTLFIWYLYFLYVLCIVLKNTI